MNDTFCFDFETTTHANGNPFSRRNRAVCLSTKNGTDPARCWFEPTSFRSNITAPGTTIIGFNIKFDLHWLTRCGISYEGCKVWCCQLAEFILERQTNPYPSLNEAAVKYGLPTKLDVVKTEYWDRGIDTDAVPRDILSEYCNYDVELTYQVYLKQLEQFEKQPKLYKLFKLACMDLLVLAEMERNGLQYNVTMCETKKLECEYKMQGLLESLKAVYPDVPINFGSGDQLSCFLYGGTISETIKEPDGVYKTGVKKGQPKYKNATRLHVLPASCKPIRGSELKKEGYFATDVKTIKQLKGPFARKYVPILLELSKLDKLISTYYEGLPKINAEMDWPEGMLHGQYNQCVAATGRLSSSKPNAQNFSGDILEIFTTRLD